MNTLNIKQEYNLIRNHKYEYVTWHNTILKTKELLLVLKTIYKIDNNATITQDSNLYHCTIKYNTFVAKLQNNYLGITLKANRHHLVLANPNTSTINLLNSQFYYKTLELLVEYPPDNFTLYFTKDTLILIANYQQNNYKASLYTSFKLTSDSKIKDPFYIENITFSQLRKLSHFNLDFIFYNDDLIIPTSGTNISFYPKVYNSLYTPSILGIYDNTKIDILATFDNHTKFINNIKLSSSKYVRIYKPNLTTLTSSILDNKPVVTIDYEDDNNLPQQLITNLKELKKEFNVTFRTNLLERIVLLDNNTNILMLTQHKVRNTYQFYTNNMMFEIDSID